MADTPHVPSFEELLAAVAKNPALMSQFIEHYKDDPALKPFLAIAGQMPTDPKELADAIKTLQGNPDGLKTLKAQYDQAIAASGDKGQFLTTLVNPVTAPPAQDFLKKALTDHDNVWAKLASATAGDERKQALAAANQTDGTFFNNVEAIYGKDIDAAAREAERAYLTLLGTDNPDATALKTAKEKAEQERQKLLAAIEEKNKADPTLAAKFSDKFKPEQAQPDANPVLNNGDEGIKAVLAASHNNSVFGDAAMKGGALDKWTVKNKPDGSREFSNGDYTAAVKPNGDMEFKSKEGFSATITDGNVTYFDKEGKPIKEADLAAAGIPDAFTKVVKQEAEHHDIATAHSALTQATLALNVRADHFVKGSSALTTDDQTAIQKQLQNYADAVKKAIAAGIDPSTIHANIDISGAASKYGGSVELNTKLAHERGQNTHDYAQQQWDAMVAKDPSLKGTLTLGRGQDVIGSTSQAGFGGNNTAPLTDAATYNAQAAPAAAPRRGGPDNAAPVALQVEDKGGNASLNDNTLTGIAALEKKLEGRAQSPAHLKLVVTDVDANHVQADIKAIQEQLKKKGIDHVEVTAGDPKQTKRAVTAAPSV